MDGPGVAMPDDEDTKVRRNLVAFSGAIVLCAWLQVPIGALAQKLIGATGWTADPLRSWVSAGAILLYLAVRFHFHGGGKAALNELIDQFLSEIHWSISDRMKKEALPGTKFSKWWTCPIEAAVEDAAQRYGVQRAEKAAKLQLFREPEPDLEKPPTFVIRPSDHALGGIWKFKGDAEIHLSWHKPDGSVADSLYGTNIVAPYSLPLPLQLAYIARSAWRASVFSEGAVIKRVPIWLCLAANLVVAFNIVGVWTA